MEILRVENLTKIYGKGDTAVTALDHVSFSIDKGEFVAVIGPSGSGKSTLLHMIGGVDTPTSGKVYIDGTDIYQLDESNLAIFRRRQIGLVYQFYNLIPILNVEENITLPLLLDGRTVKKEELRELLNTLGVEDRVGHLPNQLSGGQQQRVSIGRALVNHPAIVLADEPTGNLDSKNSEVVDTDDNVAIQITNISNYSGLVKTQNDGTVSFNLNEAINNSAKSGFNTDATFTIGTPNSGVIRIKNNSDIPVNVYMTSDNNQAIKLNPTTSSSSTIGVGSASDFYFSLDTSDQNAAKSLNAVLHVEGSSVQ
ncbi:MAG: ABC transporter ATP-binding protein [Clostridiales bacterium]|nr:ABC transporter ATP-binding protein [Clostridiales bacterium]